MHSINHCGIIIAFGKSIYVDFLRQICKFMSLQTTYKVISGILCETKEISYIICMSLQIAVADPGNYKPGGSVPAGYNFLGLVLF